MFQDYIESSLGPTWIIYSILLYEFFQDNIDQGESDDEKPTRHSSRMVPFTL